MQNVEELEKFKSEIQDHFPLRNYTYQPIIHPAFRDWKTIRPSEATLKLILKSCGNINGIKILDIGCCIGYYSHMMAKKGAKVTGIEIKSKRYEFCRYLSELYDLRKDNPTFINTDIIKFAESNREKYDLILLLNTVHWLFKQRGIEAWVTMRKISEWTDKLYLTYDEGHSHGFSPKKCIDKTLFNSVKDLGLPKSRARGQKRNVFLFRKNKSTIKTKAEKLWNDTYNRQDRPQPEWLELGLRHKATSKAICENPDISIEDLPLYSFMQEPKYELLKGSKTTIKTINTYLTNYKKVFNSIRKQGYNTEISYILTITKDGKNVIRDGHRRLNSIITLGKEDKIEVRQQ